MPELPGHDRREERRARRHGRRLVRSGDEFTSDEFDAGTVELEQRGPTPEPLDDEQAEPWNATGDDPRFRDRLRAYKEFLLQIGYSE